MIRVNTESLEALLKVMVDEIREVKALLAEHLAAGGEQS